MLAKLRNYLPLMLFAALLVALGYWNVRPESFLDTDASQTSDSEIDFFAQNAHAVQYRPDGTVRYDAHAEHLEHHANNDITYLQQPNGLVYRNTTEEPWKISSLRGEVGPGGETVELIDQVRMHRTDPRGQPNELTTSRLTLYPDRDYAQTAEPVRIVAAGGVTTATGMKAYLDDSRVLLQSNVRGQHEVR